MSKVVIFGLKDFASLGHFYLKHDSEHEVVGFTVNEAFAEGQTEFEGLPVHPFESLEEKWPNEEVKLFAPMSHSGMNKRREAIFEDGKRRGYDFISYVSSKASVFPDLSVGENCMILEDNTIQPFVKIGDNVVLWSGNHIGHHSIIEDHVFLTSHVVISGHCRIEKYCFFGVNATLRDSATVATGTLVAMSACVTKDTEAWGVYSGVPASKMAKRSDELDF